MAGKVKRGRRSRSRTIVPLNIIICTVYTFPGNLQLHKARVEEGGGQQEDTLNFRANLNNSSKASTAQPVDRYINRRFYLGYSTPHHNPASHQPLPSLKRARESVRWRPLTHSLSSPSHFSARHTENFVSQLTYTFFILLLLLCQLPPPPPPTTCATIVTIPRDRPTDQRRHRR